MLSVEVKNMKIIKKRNLTLLHKINREAETAIIERLNYVVGVEEVAVENNTTLNISYDLLEINLMKIQAILKDINYPIKESGFAKIKLGLLHYTEQNEYDNATISSSGCGSCSSGESNKSSGCCSSFEHKL